VVGPPSEETTDGGFSFFCHLRGNRLGAKEYVDQYLLTHEFVKRLHKRYNREGITIPFPIRTIHMQQTERSQAPPAADSRSGQRTEVTRG